MKTDDTLTNQDRLYLAALKRRPDDEGTVAYALGQIVGYAHDQPARFWSCRPALAAVVAYLWSQTDAVRQEASAQLNPPDRDGHRLLDLAIAHQAALLAWGGGEREETWRQAWAVARPWITSQEGLPPKLFGVVVDRAIQLALHCQAWTWRETIETATDAPAYQTAPPAAWRENLIWLWPVPSQCQMNGRLAELFSHRDLWSRRPILLLTGLARLALLPEATDRARLQTLLAQQPGVGPYLAEFVVDWCRQNVYETAASVAACGAELLTLILNAFAGGTAETLCGSRTAEVAAYLATSCPRSSWLKEETAALFRLPLSGESLARAISQRLGGPDHELAEARLAEADEAVHQQVWRQNPGGALRLKVENWNESAFTDPTVLSAIVKLMVDQHTRPVLTVERWNRLSPYLDEGARHNILALWLPGHTWRSDLEEEIARFRRGFIAQTGIYVGSLARLRALGPWGDHLIWERLLADGYQPSPKDYQSQELRDGLFLPRYKEGGCKPSPYLLPNCPDRPRLLQALALRPYEWNWPEALAVTARRYRPEQQPTAFIHEALWPLVEHATIRRGLQMAIWGPSQVLARYHDLDALALFRHTFLVHQEWRDELELGSWESQQWTDLLVQDRSFLMELTGLSLEHLLLRSQKQWSSGGRWMGMSLADARAAGVFARESQRGLLASFLVGALAQVGSNHQRDEVLAEWISHFHALDIPKVRTAVEQAIVAIHANPEHSALIKLLRAEARA